MADAFAMIARCFAHQVPWDAVERQMFLEERGVWTRYNDSNTLDTVHTAIDRDDLPPADAYYPLVWEAPE